MAMERYYRPELDVLRCFAFLMVFASHTVPVSTAAGGAFGVDLFFTLSSFLITTLLLRESSVCGALDVTAFYLRRVRQLGLCPVGLSTQRGEPPVVRFH